MPLVRRAGDRLAALLRRVWDNVLVLWLGSVVGVWEARTALWVQLVAALGVVAGGAWFVRWWEMRRLRREFLAAVAEAGPPRVVWLPSSSTAEGGE